MSKLVLLHMYPKEMNIYGDTGNRIVIEKRLEWRGIGFERILVGVGDKLPHKADIVIGGGGQDSSQAAVADDLFGKKSVLLRYVNKGSVMLMVCGMYQLLGKSFVTSDGRSIPGLGILDVETTAGNSRLVGNITVDVGGIGRLVGYENHSGRTSLGKSAIPFGSVVKGFGNDESSKMEGCRLNNLIGTYMHGPILSKNPELADYLIMLALKNNGFIQDLKPLDDSLEMKAKEVALSRPR